MNLFETYNGVSYDVFTENTELWPPIFRQGKELGHQQALHWLFILTVHTDFI